MRSRPLCPFFKATAHYSIGGPTFEWRVKYSSWKFRCGAVDLLALENVSEAKLPAQTKWHRGVPAQTTWHRRAADRSSPAAGLPRKVNGIADSPHKLSAIALSLLQLSLS